jgi:transposase-like protein
VQADPNNPPNPGEPGSLSHALATGQTQGDMAARTEHETCPGCGSNYYFSRKNAGGARPQCFECGYPVVQYSSEAGEGTAIQNTRGLQ